jgi:hypothetical protein
VVESFFNEESNKKNFLGHGSLCISTSKISLFISIQKLDNKYFAFEHFRDYALF